MKFSKHQKKILFKILSGEVYDILSYVKHFNLVEFKKIERKTIDERFAQDNIPKTYFHANELELKRANVLTDAEYNKLDSNECEYTEHNLHLKYDTGNKHIHWHDKDFIIDLYKGIYVVRCYDRILDFLIVWQYLKSNMLVLEVPQRCTAETIQLFIVENTNALNHIHDTESKINEIDFSDFSISDKYYLNGVEYQLSDEYIKFQEFFDKRIYAAPNLSIFISDGFKTKEEKIQNSALWAAWIAIFVSIALTFIPWLYEKDTSNNQSQTVESIASDINDIKHSLETVIIEESENDSQMMNTINNISEKIDTVNEKLDTVLDYYSTKSEFDSNENKATADTSSK